MSYQSMDEANSVLISLNWKIVARLKLFPQKNRQKNDHKGDSRFDTSNSSVLFLNKFDAIVICDYIKDNEKKTINSCSRFEIVQ